MSRPSPGSSAAHERPSWLPARRRARIGEYAGVKIRGGTFVEGEYELRSVSGASCAELPFVCRGNLLTYRQSEPRSVIAAHRASPESREQFREVADRDSRTFIADA